LAAKSGKKLDVYEMVTERIIAALEKGCVPWRKPWKNVGGPRNLQSKRPYRGINAFLLSLMPYSSPYWTTFKAAKAAGGSVKKGEKGTIVVLWTPIEIEDPNNPGQKKKIPYLKYYTVFNLEQCEGLTAPKNGEAVNDFEPVEEAQRVIDEMPNAPTIGFGGNRAYYRPMTDEVQLPVPEQFTERENFYATAFHELAHSTGHEKRLHRIKDWSNFGSEPYAQEELVAEMTAAMVCGMVGIDPLIEQSAAYIEGWLKALKGDKKFVVQAGSQAQKAADFILNRQFKAGDEESPAKEVVTA
jgi:antirestriction protein ArdC